MLLQVSIQVFQNHLLKIILFPIELPWHPCEKSTDHKRQGLFLGSQFYSIDLYFYSYAIPRCLEYINFVVSFEIRK